MKKNIFESGIPVSPNLLKIPGRSEPAKNQAFKKRLFKISVLAVLVAVVVSFIARALVYLINLVTNLSFYGRFDLSYHSPAAHHLGWWVIVIPAIGGLLVGFIALHGSKAIRGHGIPEAMEQILVNQSKIKPSITYLKPFSSAIAIGTGGPFGAEGPIIASGGAFGSTVGQLFSVTSTERKIILAAGATAGMSAIFGTPIASVFLAIELLLFEFSPRAILPVALACITGAVGHHLLFESGPVFHMPDLPSASNLALAVYSAIGLLIGFLALGIAKILYWIEDAFEKLPLHWMWWPALGGLAVGIIGYINPYTFGVGYENITHLLSGTLSLTFIVSLLLLKFLSWAIALGSGTSGGTLAPLLTLGGAAGAATGTIILMAFPYCGISIPMAALVGMAAMFAGASRAYLTSITFALEATMQPHALLPLLGACTASYLISYFLMENTIMTEKIARRGIYTPDAYEPDVLAKLTVGQVLNSDVIVFNEDDTVEHVKRWLADNPANEGQCIIVDSQGCYTGTVRATDLYKTTLASTTTIANFVNPVKTYINQNDSVRKAVRLMAQQGLEVIPVVTDKGRVSGILSYREVLKSYQLYFTENEQTGTHLSLKRQRIRMLVKGRKLVG